MRRGRRTNELTADSQLPARFNEFGERRPNIVANRAILGQERPAPPQILAIEFSRRGRFHRFLLG